MRWIAGVLIVSSVGACGSEPRAKPSVEQEVRAGVEAYDQALRDQDPDAICQLVSAGTQRNLTTGCMATARDYIAGSPESPRMVGTRVTAVRVDGLQATVYRAPEPSGDIPEPYTFVREGGGWKYAAGGGMGGSAEYAKCVLHYLRRIDATDGWWSKVSHGTIDEFTRRRGARSQSRGAPAARERHLVPDVREGQDPPAARRHGLGGHAFGP